jgi:hypothetical protein
MLQDFLWLFNNPIADLLLAGIFVFVALQHRQIRLLRHRTNQLAFLVSELIYRDVCRASDRDDESNRTTPTMRDGPEVPQRGPSKRFDEMTQHT